MLLTYKAKPSKNQENKKGWLARFHDALAVANFLIQRAWGSYRQESQNNKFKGSNRISSNNNTNIHNQSGYKHRITYDDYDKGAPHKRQYIKTSFTLIYCRSFARLLLQCSKMRLLLLMWGRRRRRNLFVMLGTTAELPLLRRLHIIRNSKLMCTT